MTKINNKCYPEFQLLFTGAQKILINEMFLGPDLMLDLLKKEEKFHIDSKEIKLFLLKSKAMLYPYICEYLHDNPGILAQVFYRIAISKDGENRLDFLGNCSISRDNKIYFPVKKLGLVSLADVNSFSSWKTNAGDRNYYDNFSILKRNNVFFVEIPVQSKKSNYKESIENLENKTKLTKKCIDNNHSDDILKYIDCGNEISPSERKVASAVSIAMRLASKRYCTENNQGGGSIWTVSGGLPSLGKRN